MKKQRIILASLFLGAIAVGIFILAIFADIREKKIQTRAYPLMLNKVSDENPDFAEWGKNFPSQLESFLKMKDANTPTQFGGSLPYSKLIRYPQLTTLWGGYAFAVDFNEDRSHYYTQIDQVETIRNNKEYLNAHGLAAFKSQPGACINCHTGWLTWIKDQKGWDWINKTPYFEVMQFVKETKGEGIHGAHLGSTCADCHHPQDMSLRITRPAYLNAMKARGYELDEKQGIKANRQEMRSHVCQQCHVEYYFRGKGKTLTFPWNEWKKDQVFRIEMFDAYYDNPKTKEIFQKDWQHRDTKAPMLKIQHPETEMSSSGIHARSGVACADCHMPYKREGAQKVTDHFIGSPLHNIKGSCQTCHMDSEETLKKKILTIQMTTASNLRRTENAMVAFIKDIQKARALLAQKKDFADIQDAKEREKAISKLLVEVLERHRKASMRWDFVFSENSTGFHSPQESARVLGQAMDLARSGQALLISILAKQGIEFSPTMEAMMPQAPQPIQIHKFPVNSKPPQISRNADKQVEDLDF